MIKKLAALIEVRKIIALMFASAFTYMTITGKFEPMVAIPLITMAIGYYFGKSTALDIPNRKDPQ